MILKIFSIAIAISPNCSLMVPKQKSVSSSWSCQELRVMRSAIAGYLQPVRLMLQYLLKVNLRRGKRFSSLLAWKLTIAGGVRSALNDGWARLLAWDFNMNSWRAASSSQVIPFPNQTWREGGPRTVSIIRQGEADKVSFDLEMELLSIFLQID